MARNTPPLNSVDGEPDWLDRLPSWQEQVKAKSEARQAERRREQAARSAASEIPNTPESSRLVALKTVVDHIGPSAHAVRWCGKVFGRAIAGNPEESTLRAHIRGDLICAIHPVIPDGQPYAAMTRLAVIDIDDKKGEQPSSVVRAMRTLLQALKRERASPNVTVSSGGHGIHMQILFEDWLDARHARSWLARLIEAEGYTPGNGGVGNGNVEIFPKQDQVTVGHPGNHIALPFHNWHGMAIGPGRLRDECVPALVFTRTDIVPRGSGQLSTHGDPSPNTELLRPNYGFVGQVDKALASRFRIKPEYYAEDLKSTLMRLAERGDTVIGEDAHQTPIGLCARDAWRNTGFACKSAATEFPEHAEEIWEFYDAASYRAHQVHGANYDADMNREQWERWDGRHDGITLRSIFKAAQQWDWPGSDLAAADAGADTPATRPIQQPTLYGNTAEGETPSTEGHESNNSKVPSHWQAGLKRTENGKPRPLLLNVLHALRSAPEWNGVLAFDVMKQQPIVRRSPPWDRMRELKHGAPWLDHYDTRTTEWMQQHGIEADTRKVREAIEAVAHDQEVHPVKEYLQTLQWDGVPRIDEFLSTYFGAESTPYHRAIGPRWLISAIARVFEPGCKADHMLIFEGEQGTFKSMALEHLSSPWFVECSRDIESKDAVLQIHHAWIVHFTEFKYIRNADVNVVKEFLTRTRDTFRPPYGSRVVELLRTCVFAGALNPSGGYLRDETGARRFWPVACGICDHQAVRRDREQLWAEALMRYKRGDRWWLDNDELVMLAASEQRARFEGDEWEGLIREYLRGQRTGVRMALRSQPILEVSVAEILTKVFGIDPKDWRQCDQNRVAKCLVNLGFRRTRKRTADGSRPYWYVLSAKAQSNHS